MSKKRNKTQPLHSTDAITLIVTEEIMKRIVAGEIKSTLLTFKDIAQTYKGKLTVMQPAHDDEAIHYSVKQVVKVGHGYLADGYPEHYRVKGYGIALRVERLDDRSQDTSNVSDASEAEANRAPTEDEGTE